MMNALLLVNEHAPFQGVPDAARDLNESKQRLNKMLEKHRKVVQAREDQRKASQLGTQMKSLEAGMTSMAPSLPGNQAV